MSRTPPSSPIQPLSPLSPISPWPSIPSADDCAHSASDAHGDALPNATDVYASIAILGTYLSFALYLFWATVPPEWEWTGWLPDREWTVIVPCWLMVIVLLAYWTYAALIIYNAPPSE
ncbi:phosphatidylinositol glycan, class P [Cryptococcus neoformans var. grubii Br795]|nr:phosphatidylinositol glycan, class P [Cryptococcus neoformans var. grubii Bt120]OXG83791.1 phosphatidylinositol glycan, class P [Cryptococcus neoformans var. grubii Br795]